MPEETREKTTVGSYKDLKGSFRALQTAIGTDSDPTVIDYLFMVYKRYGGQAFIPFNDVVEMLSPVDDADRDDVIERLQKHVVTIGSPEVARRFNSFDPDSGATDYRKLV